MNPIAIFIVVLFLCFSFVVLRGAPYIPSHRSQVRRALSDLYPIGATDHLVDLGSGDGTVLSIARDYGAKATGYEINPLLWLMTKLRFRTDDKAHVQLQDYSLLSQLPSDVTVVYAFTTSRSIETIGKKLEQWSKHQDLRFISYGFTLADRRVDATSGPMNLYLYKKHS